MFSDKLSDNVRTMWREVPASPLGFSSRQTQTPGSTHIPHDEDAGHDGPCQPWRPWIPSWHMAHTEVVEGKTLETSIETWNFHGKQMGIFKDWSRLIIAKWCSKWLQVVLWPHHEPLQHRIICLRFLGAWQSCISTASSPLNPGLDPSRASFVDFQVQIPRTRRKAHRPWTFAVPRRRDLGHPGTKGLWRRSWKRTPKNHTKKRWGFAGILKNLTEHINGNFRILKWRYCTI